MPMAPASDAAATSSGLEHGYIAPQMMGYSIPTCLVKRVGTGATVRERRAGAPRSARGNGGQGGAVLGVDHADDAVGDQNVRRGRRMDAVERHVGAERCGGAGQVREGRNGAIRVEACEERVRVEI